MLGTVLASHKAASYGAESIEQQENSFSVIQRQRCKLFNLKNHINRDTREAYLSAPHISVRTRRSNWGWEKRIWCTSCAIISLKERSILLCSAVIPRKNSLDYEN